MIYTQLIETPSVAVGKTLRNKQGPSRACPSIAIGLHAYIKGQRALHRNGNRRNLTPTPHHTSRAASTSARALPSSARRRESSAARRALPFSSAHPRWSSSFCRHVGGDRQSWRRWVSTRRVRATIEVQYPFLAKTLLNARPPQPRTTLRNINLAALLLVLFIKFSFVIAMRHFSSSCSYLFSCLSRH